MSKKANPAAIGLFVVVAILIAVASIITLGSGKLFKVTEPYVLYFTGNLGGLDVGAPVEYNGVRIGAVTDIRFEYHTDKDFILIPVYIEIDPSLITVVGHDTGNDVNQMENLIHRGLRAQLQSQSIVTGKLKVMLSMMPSTPLVLLEKDLSMAEIPTVPNLLESLEERLKDLPIRDIVTNLDELTQNLAQLSDSGKFRSILEKLDTTAGSVSEMASSPEWKNAILALNSTLSETEILAKNINGSVDPVTSDLTTAMTSFSTSMDDFSTTMGDFSATIVEFKDTAKAAQSLLDYLERHPEALIHGKGKE